MSDRRHFLAAVAGVALAACGRRASSSTASPEPGDLARFMALSSLLAGYGGLDAGIGSTYLAAIEGDATRAASLNRLYEKAGLTSNSPPASLADLEKRGVFRDPASLAAANDVLQSWFGGIYRTAGGQVTATWTQALAWKACSFTKPPSECAAPGSWAKAPA